MSYKWLFFYPHSNPVRKAQKIELSSPSYIWANRLKDVKWLVQGHIARNSVSWKRSQRLFIANLAVRYHTIWSLVQNHGCMCPCLVMSAPCLSPCDSMVYSLPGSSVQGIFQARNTGGGCHYLLQSIFPTRDQSPHSCVSCIGRQILYHQATWETQNYDQRVGKKNIVRKTWECYYAKRKSWQ